MPVPDRVSELQSWTTSRKTAVVGLFSVAIIGFNGVLGHVLLAPLTWVDLRWWDWLLALMTVQFAGTSALAWAVSRSGTEGRWVFYLWGPPNGVLTMALLYAFGSLSSPMMVILPLSVAMVIVYFDEGLAWLAIVATLILLTASVVVAASDWLPYAPALDGRDVDLQSSPRFVLTMGWVVLSSCTAFLLLMMAMTRSARRTSARLDHAHRLIARYVPTEVAQDILTGQLSHDDGHHRRRLTVFFSDLVGFSDVAEELEPEDLALVLNDYFGEMTAIAHRHHGTVDELQGDALLILFGAPHATTDREHALNAVRMATDMQAAMAVLNERWARAGITETLRVRMGINTGVVTVGNFGTAERMKYAALGKHVNVAARLQAIAEPGATVISFSTYLLVKDEIACTALGPQQLKGITKPVEAYAPR